MTSLLFSLSRAKFPEAENSREQSSPKHPEPGKCGEQLPDHSWGLSRLQDEMELGYVQAPHKTFPVVFDSPRNGELQEFPYKRILVSGPGHSPALKAEGPYTGGHTGVMGTRDSTSTLVLQGHK